MTFGEFVRAYRNGTRQNTRTAAVEMGIARGTLSKIERDVNLDTITVGQICKIAGWAKLHPDAVWRMIMQDRSSK